MNGSNELDLEPTKAPKPPPEQELLNDMVRARYRWWWWVAYGTPDCAALDEYARAAIPDDAPKKCGDFKCQTCAWYPDDLDECKRVVAQKRAEFRADKLKFHRTEFDSVKYEFWDWFQPTVDHYAWLIRRGRKLCLKHPPAVQGDNGSLTCFRLFLALVKGLGIDGSIAAELAWVHYNPRCVDRAGEAAPWSWEELVHKANDAVASPIPVGFLLHDQRPTHDDDGEGADQRGAPASVAPTSRPTSSNSLMTASGSSTAATKPPVNLTTVEIIGINGLHTKDKKLDVDTIRLRIADGPFAGRVRSLKFDWPPSPRSAQRWTYLAKALSLVAIMDPKRELLGRRFAVELELDARFEFRIGGFHRLP